MSYARLFVSIRRTRLARFAKGFVFTMLAQFVDAVCVIASNFMPLSGGTGSQTLVLTGLANTYTLRKHSPNPSAGGGAWGAKATLLRRAGRALRTVDRFNRGNPIGQLGPTLATEVPRQE